MDKPQCDIIIPVFDRLVLTKNCLESIYKQTRTPFNLLIVDNASGPQMKSFLKNLEYKHKNMSIIENSENLGWVRAVNQGMALSKGEYVCIMNNDTVVRTEDWLSKMIRIAESEDDIGLVNPIFEIKRSPAKDKPYIEVDFCRGYCILIKRALIDKIGVLDEAYGLGYYDDDDYSVRAIRAGFRCVRANDVVVEHLRDSTFTALFREDNRRALHEKNKELFYSKWGRRLRLVFIVTKDADKKKALEDLFSLARKQHIIYVWNLGLPLKAEHINIRERLFPSFFPRSLFTLMIYLNKLKRPSKRYDKVFVDRSAEPD